MKCNEGSTDRLVRLILGATLITAGFLFLALMEGALWGVLAGAVGAVLVLTSILGFCPAYKICGMSTCDAKPEG